ncbi:MAG: DUF3052 domain-containing protein [Chloroflexota bacterium]
MAGYSKRSLAQKLGLKAGHKTIILNPPADYDRTLGELPPQVTVVDTLNGPFDFIQFFTKERGELEKHFPQLRAALAPDGMLWISWPKRSSKVETDLTEAVVREIGLDNGLVDVKVAAIDQIWSGLRFVYRLKDRK